MSNVSDKYSRGNQNTHFLFNNFFSFENSPVYEIMWQTTVDWGQATDYNKAHVHCMLDN